MKPPQPPDPGLKTGVKTPVEKWVSEGQVRNPTRWLVGNLGGDKKRRPLGSWSDLIKKSITAHRNQRPFLSHKQGVFCWHEQTEVAKWPSGRMIEPSRGRVGNEVDDEDSGIG